MNLESIINDLCPMYTQCTPSVRTIFSKISSFDPRMENTWKTSVTTYKKMSSSIKLDIGLSDSEVTECSSHIFFGQPKMVGLYQTTG